MNLPGVVAYHAVDEQTPAVQMAAEKIEIKGLTPVSASLDIEQIINACKKTGLMRSIRDLDSLRKMQRLPGGLNRRISFSSVRCRM